MLFTEAIVLFESWKKWTVKEKSVVTYCRFLRNLCLHLGNPQVGDIELKQILAFLTGLKEISQVQHNTLIPICLAYRKFFEFCGMQNLSSFDWRLIPIPQKIYSRPRIISQETFNAFNAAIPETSADPRHIRNKALVWLLWETGARIGELLALNASDISVTKSVLIKTEKNRGSAPERQIFWREEGDYYLRKWMKIRAELYPYSEPLFMSICQKPGARLGLSGVSKIMHQYSIKAKLGTMVNCHSFRHHFCRDVVERGGDASMVMSLAGHSSIVSSTPYVRLFGKDLKRGYERIFEQNK